MRIFLVATCPFVCERLPELLEEDGRYIVLGCANTFDAAVEGITASKPDIAIVDSKLEQCTGIDVLAEAKRRLPGLLGIVVSNQLTARDRKAALDGMAAWLMTKPAQVAELAVVVW